MENTSKQARVVSRRDRAFYRRRFQHRIHAAIATLFAEEAAVGHITKKQLADLLERNPAQITRWLSEPSNIESDTISDILLGMGAEMEPRIVRFREVGKGNQAHPLIVRIEKNTNTVRFDKQPPKNSKSSPYQKLASPESNARVLVLEPM
jgi:hypothetical protein